MRPPLARQSSMARSTAQSEHCELSTGTRISRYIAHRVTGYTAVYARLDMCNRPVAGTRIFTRGPRREGVVFLRAIRLLEAFIFWHHADPIDWIRWSNAILHCNQLCRPATHRAKRPPVPAK